MADYYSILDKTISGLPNNTPEIRNAVFKKARTAIETQLRNMDPMPSEEAIASQLKLLEEAIVVIDSEYTPVIDPTPVSTPEPVTPQVADQDTASLTELQQVSEPLPTEPAPVTPTPVEPEVVKSAPIAPAQTPETVVERVESAIDQIQSDTPPTVGLDVAEPSRAQPNVGSVAVDPATQDILDPIVSAQADDTSSSNANYEEEKSGGFLSRLIKLLVVLGLLGGAGYAVWKNKEELTSFANSFMQTSEVVEETDPEPEPEPAAEVETPTPEPEPVEPEVTEPEVVQPETTEPEIVEPEVVEPEVVEPETNTTEEPVIEETQPTTQESGVIPIGEVAYLYEEGSAGSGATRTNAAITWELKQESLKEGNPPEPVIIGKMDVPDKGMSIDIKLKRNIDEAVSASHMIELRFNIPADFSGKSVESIARFVMKLTEEAPGEPLVAVPVKVSDGFFLIALDNLTQAVAVNTQLLKESAWIDVPVVYGTGKRALITLEKGGTGERVFDEAFRDWQNR